MPLTHRINLPPALAKINTLAKAGSSTAAGKVLETI